VPRACRSSTSVVESGTVQCSHRAWWARTARCWGRRSIPRLYHAAPATAEITVRLPRAFVTWRPCVDRCCGTQRVADAFTFLLRPPLSQTLR
jgi:hypothetical protein